MTFTVVYKKDTATDERPSVTDLLTPSWFTDPPISGHYWAYNSRTKAEVEFIRVIADRGQLFAYLRGSITPLAEFTHFKAAEIPEPPKADHDNPAA